MLFKTEQRVSDIARTLVRLDAFFVGRIAPGPDSALSEDERTPCLLPRSRKSLLESNLGRKFPVLMIRYILPSARSVRTVMSEAITRTRS